RAAAALSARALRVRSHHIRTRAPRCKRNGGEAQQMKASVQDGYGSADVLQLREVDKPAVADDRVLVRVRAASVNALDWHTVHGGWFMRGAALAMRQPVFSIRGVDVAGVVEAVGAKVTQVRPGDAVFGTGRGTSAEYTTTREDRILPKPPAPSLEPAAAKAGAGVRAPTGPPHRPAGA